MAKDISEAKAQAPQQEHYCLFDTAIGLCGVAWSERGLTRVQLPEADRDSMIRSAQGGVFLAWGTQGSRLT